MVDRHDPREPEHVADADTRRITFAAARIADHAERELELLDRARHAEDARRARELEYRAGTAHRDSIALTEEHGLGR
jgi:hypothetical protein